ncbi:MAG: aminoacyl-tRNA hydrolase, partial [Halobacteriovoraceae bacterium]|nr:aminoacyl-tRNA hydrolase [Halobacteriovoraceae bacterium]
MNKLIVALGNPGKKYESTRHNVAWQAFARLAFHSELTWKNKFKGVYADYLNHETKFIFLMPQTYMNLSGFSVQDCMNFFKISPQETLVVHDEVDIPYGVCAFKKGGGLAGHN